MTPPAIHAPAIASGVRGNPAALFGADAYPPGAIRRGAQGRVVARLIIGADGRVSRCAIGSSSGDADLDAATCSIGSRVRFGPARDGAGRAIASVYPLAVRWVLPTDAWPTAPEREDAVSPGLQPMNRPAPAPKHRHRHRWFGHLWEAHHLIGLATVVLGALATRLRRLLSWSRTDADGREIVGDQIFARRRRRRGAVGDRVISIAGTVLPIVLVAVGLAWLGL